MDDKIYYLSYPLQGKPGTVTIMRCNLDGSKKEKLFQYQYTLEYQNWINTENLRIDGDYIYLLGEYSGIYGLARIPLYGGKIKGVTENVGDIFDLSDNSVFFSDYYDKYIYKVDKALSATPTAVTKTYYCEYGFHSMESRPFHCAGRHLMVQASNKKKREIADKALDYAFFLEKWDLWADVESFAPDYYWITEDGKVKRTIKGSGVKKKWKKIAATWEYDD